MENICKLVVSEYLFIWIINQGNKCYVFTIQIYYRNQLIMPQRVSRLTEDENLFVISMLKKTTYEGIRNINVRISNEFNKKYQAINNKYRDAAQIRGIIKNFKLKYYAVSYIYLFYTISFNLHIYNLHSTIINCINYEFNIFCFIIIFTMQIIYM